MKNVYTKYKIFAICLLIMSTVINPAIGQEQTEGVETDAVHFIKGARLESENDVFFPVNNKDKNYTGQFRLEIFVRDIFDKGVPFPFIKNASQRANNLQSFFFHGMGYTPAREYFSSTTPVTTDRPFASYICGGFQRTSWWDNIGLSVTTELTLGKIGASAPGKVQNFLHEYITVKSEPVKGWANQIGYPGRFAFYYKVNGAWMPEKFKRNINVFNKNINLNTGLRYDFMFGTFMTYQKIGLSISSLELSDLAMAPDISSLTDAASERVRFGVEIYPSIKHVTWNSMLQGHPTEDQSVYKIPKESLNRWVPELSMRLKLMILKESEGRVFTIFYNANVRGKEFSYGDHIHFWGTLGIQTMKF